VIGMSWFVALLALALILWLIASRLRQRSGLPGGEVVYSDTGAWGRVEQPLFSAELQLTGKPDYVVREGGAVVPVEVKSGRAPAQGAYAAHLYQLAAYCALVTEAYGQRPRYGLIKYADKLLKIPYTAQLEAELRDLLAAMREDAGADDVERSHDSAARCRACGFREVCDERLV
jgi:CRISPR-associated exonuclease Cas4